MEGREFVFALLGVIFVAMAFNFFFVDIGSKNNLSEQSGIDMEYFNKTQSLTQTTEEFRNETTFLENVYLIGDIAAVVGSAAKAMKMMYDIPGLYINMISQVGLYVGVPGWVLTIATTFVWVLVVFIVVSFFRGYRG